MNDLMELWDVVVEWLTKPLLNIGGDSPITASRLLAITAIMLVVWWFASVVERTIRNVASRRRDLANPALIYAWARVLRYTVFIVGTLIGLSLLGFQLTSLAFLGGTIGVGIGFGLQNVFSNFVSGIIILMEGTLKLGDFVEFPDGARGQVKEIGLRYTRILTNDAVDILVPNSEFINSRVTNWTFETQVRRLRVPFGVAYGSDKEAVRAAGLRAATSVTGTLPDPAPEVWLAGFGDSSLNFELVVWLGHDMVIRPARTIARYNWAIETELRAGGIEIPFPQRDLHVRSGVLQVRQVQEGDGSPPAGGRSAPTTLPLEVE
jgi:small-conductance mechanosensitive channel